METKESKRLNWSELCTLLRAVSHEIQESKKIVEILENTPSAKASYEIKIMQLQKVERILSEAQDKVLRDCHKAARIEIEF